MSDALENCLFVRKGGSFLKIRQQFVFILQSTPKIQSTISRPNFCLKLNTVFTLQTVLQYKSTRIYKLLSPIPGAGAISKPAGTAPAAQLPKMPLLRQTQKYRLVQQLSCSFPHGPLAKQGDVGRVPHFSRIRIRIRTPLKIRAVIGRFGQVSGGVIERIAK